MGTDDSPELLTSVRTHANNAEFMPLALVMMLLVELCGGNSMALHSYGGMLFVGRLAHAYGMPRRAPNPYRVAGSALTWGGILMSAAYLMWLRRGAPVGSTPSVASSATHATESVPAARMVAMSPVQLVPLMSPSYGKKRPRPSLCLGDKDSLARAATKDKVLGRRRNAVAKREQP